MLILVRAALLTAEARAAEVGARAAEAEAEAEEGTVDMATTDHRAPRVGHGVSPRGEETSNADDAVRTYMMSRGARCVVCTGGGGG